MIFYGFPVPVTDGLVTFMLPVHIFMRMYAFPMENGHHTSTLQRIYVIVMICRRIFCSCNFNKGGHNIYQVGWGIYNFILPVMFNAIRPAYDKRRRNTTFFQLAFP